MKSAKEFITEEKKLPEAVKEFLVPKISNEMRKSNIEITDENIRKFIDDDLKKGTKGKIASWLKEII